MESALAVSFGWKSGRIYMQFIACSKEKSILLNKAVDIALVNLGKDCRYLRASI